MIKEIETLPSPPSVPAPGEQDAEADAQFSARDVDPPARVCPNCDAPVHGPFCYACGQSEKGMIRHLSEVLSDLADIVFNVDSRIFRSLFDLYFRPGYLTTEYVAGRRARYVTPFRLFFFLSILAFFTIQLVVPADLKLIDYDEAELNEAVQVEKVSGPIVIESLRSALAVPGLEPAARERIQAQIDLLTAKQEASAKPVVADDGAGKPLNGKEPAAIKNSGDKGGAADADSKTVSVEPESCESGRPGFRLGRKWLCPPPNQTFFLPGWANRKVDSWVDHAVTNFNQLTKEPGRLVAGWIAVLPQTLFVLMPLFAVILKIFYIFRRRLYMEHLLVALHSHAFIFMAIMVIVGIYLLRSAAVELPAVYSSLGWLQAIAVAWLFIYLLLMQKRVYRQGWFMTVLKFCVIGYCYVVVLTTAFIISALISLAIT